MGNDQNVQEALTDAQKLAKRNEADAAEEKSLNSGRTGKGTRITIGYTRGKGSQRIKYENFEKSQPETLPTSIAEFASLANVSDESKMVEYLIDGFNAAMYRESSDPISEFVEAHWPEEIQKSFRLAVKNLVSLGEWSLEDAVNVAKTPLMKKYPKS